jgi:hypothetical protein
MGGLPSIFDSRALNHLPILVLALFRLQSSSSIQTLTWAVSPFEIAGRDGTHLLRLADVEPDFRCRHPPCSQRRQARPSSWQRALIFKREGAAGDIRLGGLHPGLCRWGPRTSRSISSLHLLVPALISVTTISGLAGNRTRGWDSDHLSVVRTHLAAISKW